MQTVRKINTCITEHAIRCSTNNSTESKQNLVFKCAGMPFFYVGFSLKLSQNVAKICCIGLHPNKKGNKVVFNHNDLSVRRIPNDKRKLNFILNRSEPLVQKVEQDFRITLISDKKPLKYLEIDGKSKAQNFWA